MSWAPPAGATCTTMGTLVGPCSPGTMACVNGVYSCFGGRLPTVEQCDGRDNDCDGSVDDGNPGGGASCGTDAGDCVAGTQQCVGGLFSCQGEVLPAPELCDGSDNDCDGNTDEGCP